MREKGFNPSLVVSCLNGRLKTHKGFIYKRITTPQQLIYDKRRK